VFEFETERDTHGATPDASVPRGIHKAHGEAIWIRVASIPIVSD
jgi:hypothetical protein